MLTILLHLLAGLVLAGWGALQAELASLAAWSCAMAACGGAMAGLGWWLARRTWPASPARLRWDGRQWLGADDAPGRQAGFPLGRVVVALDLGTWVLLQLHPADAGLPVWRPASTRGARQAWHGLRLALAAHAGAAPPAGDAGADR